MMDISPSNDRPRRTNTPAYLTLPFARREIEGPALGPNLSFPRRRESSALSPHYRSP